MADRGSNSSEKCLSSKKLLKSFARSHLNRVRSNIVLNSDQLHMNMSRTPIFKGAGYWDYARHMNEPEYIFTREFPNWTPESTRRIADGAGVPISTISSWRKRWMGDRSWRPTNSAHGTHHRVFTDEEEQGISKYIFKNFIMANRAFTNQDFKDLCMAAVLEKHKEGPIPTFCVSQGFIQDFKDRNFFSSGRAHPKKRPERDPAKEEHFYIA